MVTMKLVAGEFLLMRDIIQHLTGVSLAENKGYLIETRLGPLGQKFGCSTFNEMYFELKYGRNKALTDEVVDAITTHETSFFRDGTAFDALQYKLLHECLEARAAAGQRKQIRIWSAACSSGQEPYSIGMVAEEIMGMAGGWTCEIVATDISPGTLEQAQRGVYAEHEIRRTTRPQLIDRYFQKVGSSYEINADIKAMVQWRQLNLLKPLPAIGKFDIVFLRNVLIYFDPPTRKQIAQRVADTLQPHGWLVAGGSENLSDIGPNFVPETHCRAVCYRPGMPATAR